MIDIISAISYKIKLSNMIIVSVFLDDFLVKGKK